MTIPRIFNLAIERHRAGRLAEAETLYRQVLAAQPHDPDALHLLGLLANEMGRYDAAAELIGRAIAADPTVPEYHFNLANALLVAGRWDQAVAEYRRVIELRPDFAEAHNNLGITLTKLMRFDEAIDAYRRALGLQPDFALACQNLGGAFHHKGDFDQAAHWYRKAVQIQPEYAEAYFNLGQVFSGAGRFDEAIAAYHQAIQLKPDLVEAHDYLGFALYRQGENDAAIAAFRQALALRPDFEQSLFNLANVLAADGKFDEAMGEYRRAPVVTHAKPVSKTTGTVFAVCSIRNGGTELLPHWLEHYSKLGVDKLVVGVFDDVSPAARNEIDRCAERWRFTCVSQTWKGVNESLMAEQRRAGCRLAGAQAGTWIMHTDLDEFHEYPAPLREIIAGAQAKGITAVIGWWLDRVAEDGSLPMIRSSPSLWEQFPIGCRLTAKILRTVTQKIMLARFDVPVQNGHHHVARNEGLGLVPIGRADQYIVHHFKWHGNLLSRLEWSLSQPNTQPEWKIDAKRFLAWLNAGGGKINLDDPALSGRENGCRLLA